MTSLDHSEAYLNGWLAHKNNEEQDFNPYREGAQQYSYNQWLSGWCDRFRAVKHGYDLTLDEEIWL
jgi:hypothetical protein